MANESYEVRFIGEEKGKGIFACRAFKEDEVILEEKPLVCCQYSWNAEYGYLACDNCMRALESAEENARRLSGKTDLILPYPECCETRKDLIVKCDDCGTKYCSIECKKEAFEKYHRTLCVRSKEKDLNHPLTQVNENWKQLHYPPESTSVMLFARIAALASQVPSAKQALLNFCHKTTNEEQDIAHNLLGEKFYGQIEFLREALASAMNIEAVSEWFTPDGFRSLLALVGTNGQGIGTTAFGRWARNVLALKLPEDEKMEVENLIERIYDDMDEVVGMFLNNDGSGLYVLQSSVNHSCAPNAVVDFVDGSSTLSLKASCEIQPGDEICISYLSNCELHQSRHTRQKMLAAQYLFRCQCAKCFSQASDPDVTSEEDDDDDMSV